MCNRYTYITQLGNKHNSSFIRIMKFYFSLSIFFLVEEAGGGRGGVEGVVMNITMSGIKRRSPSHKSHPQPQAIATNPQPQASSHSYKAQATATSGTTRHTVDGINSCTLGPVGSIRVLLDLDFYMVILGVGRGPIGLVAPLRFKTLDSQPEKSNMGPVSTKCHDF